MATYIPNAGASGFDSGINFANMYNQAIMQATHDAAQQSSQMVQKTFDALQKARLLQAGTDPNYQSDRAQNNLKNMIDQYQRSIRGGTSTIWADPEAPAPTENSDVGGGSTEFPIPTAQQLLEQRRQAQARAQEQAQQQPTQQQPVQPQQPVQQPLPQPPMQPPMQPPVQQPVNTGQNALPGLIRFPDPNPPNFNQGRYINWPQRNQ